MLGDMGLKGWAGSLSGLLSYMTAHGACPVGNQEPSKALIRVVMWSVCILKYSVLQEMDLRQSEGRPTSKLLE